MSKRDKKNNNIKTIALWSTILLSIIAIVIVVTSNYDGIIKLYNNSAKQEVDDGSKAITSDAGQKALVTSVSISEIKTGTAPFDGNNDPGNDDSENNNVVRTLDKMTWKFTTNMEIRPGQDITSLNEGTLYFTATLPPECEGKVRWNLDGMSWTAGTGQVSEDGLKFSGYYVMGANQISIPGSQDVLFTADVDFAEDGFEFTPEFTAFLVGGNQDTETVTLRANEGGNNTTRVSAKSSVNVVLKDIIKRYSVMIDGQEKLLYGYAMAYRMEGDNEEKGLRGLEKAVGTLEFDISYSLLQIGGTDIPSLENYIHFYAIKYNDIDDSTVIQGGEIKDIIYEEYWSSHGVIPSSHDKSWTNGYVYQNGNLKVEDNGGGKLHVTIENCDVKNGCFPTKKDWGGSIDANQGYVSTGLLYIIVDVDENILPEDGSTKTRIVVETSSVKLNGQEEEETTPDDNSVNNEVRRETTGTFEKSIEYNGENLSGRLSSNWNTGDSVEYICRNISISNNISVGESNSVKNWAKGVDILNKFDDEAFEPILMDDMQEYSAYNNIMTFNILYAAKKSNPNEGWSSDDEMISTTMEELIYFDTLEQLKEKNYVCVAVLAESQEGTIRGGYEENVKIKYRIKDTAVIDKIYQTTNDVRIYGGVPDRNTQTHLYNTEITKDAFPEIIYSAENYRYIKSDFDEYGNLQEGTHITYRTEEDTATYGVIGGDSIKLLCAKLRIDIAAMDENLAQEKYYYNIGNEENEVIYKVSPRFEKHESGDSPIEDVKLKVTVVLPKGLEYIPGSSSCEEPIVTISEEEATAGLTVLTWYREGCSTEEPLEEITFRTYIDELSENNIIYTAIAVIDEEPQEDGTYKVGNSDYGNAKERVDKADIQITNLTSWVLTKRIIEPAIEIGGTAHYIITFANTSSDEVPNFQILDILPYNDDGRATNYAGEYTLDHISVTSTRGVQIYTTTNEEIRTSGAKTTDQTLTTQYGFNLVQNADSREANVYNIHEKSTALAIKGSLGSKEKIVLDVYLKTENNGPMDIYSNDAKAATEASQDEILTRDVYVNVVERQIEGKVWIDIDKNGLMSSSEPAVRGIQLQLLTENGGLVTDVLGQVVQNATTDEYGMYYFSKLPKGKYKIKIIFDPEQYELTTKKVGRNEKINSKFDKESYETDVIETLDVLNNDLIIEDNVNAGLITEGYVDADINVEKKAYIQNSNLDYAVEGDTIRYEINVSRDGAFNGNVKIQDSIPVGTTFVPGSITINGEKRTELGKEQLEAGIEISTESLGVANAHLKIMDNPPSITYAGNIESDALSQLENGIMTQAYNNYGASGIFESYDSILENDGSYTKGIIGRNYARETGKISNPEAYTVEFSIEGDKFLVGHQSEFFRVSVDELDGNGYMMCGYEGTKGENADDSTGYFIIQFNESKKRNIKIELSQRFIGVAVPTGGKISKVERQVGQKALFIGDDMTSGGVIDKNGYASYANGLCSMFGFECMNNGADSTGYVADNSGYWLKYYDRLTDLYDKLNPDIVFLQGGRHDKDSDSATIESNVRNCIDYVVNQKSKKLVIIGVFPGNHLTDSNYNKYKVVNDLLRKIAIESHVPFIDLLAGETITKDGAVEKRVEGPYLTTSNQSEILSGTSSDLSVAGHKYFAEQLAPEVAKVLNLNGSITLCFDVTVDTLKKGLSKKTISNVAVVNDDFTTEPAEVTVRKPEVDFVTKATKKAIVDNPEIGVEEGETIKYEIEIENTGSSEGTAIVQDNIPKGTTFVDKSIKINDVAIEEYGKADLESGISIDLGKKPELKYMQTQPEITTYEDTKTTEVEAIVNGTLIQPFTLLDKLASYDSTLIKYEATNESKGIVGENKVLNKDWFYTTGYTVEFSLGDSNIFAIKTHDNNGIRISVDELDGKGYLLSNYEGYTPTITTESGDVYYVVKFNESKKRNIKIELNGRIYGMVVPDGVELSKVLRNSNKKVLFVGDNMLYNYSIPSYTSFANTISTMFGYECRNNGVDGAGYISETVKYTDIITKQMEKFNPDIVVLQGGREDYNQSDEDIKTNIQSCIDSVKNAGKQIVIMGIWPGQYNNNASRMEKYNAVNDIIKEKARENEIGFIDLINGQTISAKGEVITDKGEAYITDANAGQILKPGQSTPSVEGFKYLSNALVDEFAKLISKSNKATLSFEVRVENAQGLPNSEITNVAYVNEEPTDIVTTKVIEKQVSAIKRAKIQNKFGYVREGDIITYEIEASQPVSSSTTNKIQDTIPEGTEFVEGSITVNGEKYMQDSSKEEQIQSLQNGINVPGTIKEIDKEIKVLKEPPQIISMGTSQESKIINRIENGEYISAQNGHKELNDEYYTVDNAELEMVANSNSRVLGKNYPKDNEDITNSWDVEFTINSTEFMIRLSSDYFRIYVDEGNGYELTSLDPIKGMDDNFYHVIFEKQKKRNIKLELTGEFGGVIAPKGALSKIQKSTKKALYLGDAMSFSDMIWDKGCISYVNTMANMLGLDIINNSSDGIGYKTKNKKSDYYNFEELLKMQLEKFNPDIVFFQGGRQDNSGGETNEDVVASADKCYKYVKQYNEEHSTDIKIIVIGLWSGASSTSSDRVQLNTQLRQTALNNEVPYIDVVTGETILGNGTVITRRGEGYITESNEATYTKDKDLNVEGHYYMAQELAVEVDKILRDFSGTLQKTSVVTYQVRVNDLQDDKLTDTIKNTAQVNDIDTPEVQTEVKKLNITENKSVEVVGAEDGRNYAIGGEKLKYTIEVQNSGSVDQDIYIRDIIPDGTRFVKGSILLNGSPIEGLNEKEIYEQEEQLANGISIKVTAGQTVKLTFEVTVDNLAEGEYDREILNVAEVNGKNTNTQTTEVRKPNISVAKEVTTQLEDHIVTQGDEITYKITITNHGKNKEKVKVKDIIPEGTQLKENSVKIGTGEYENKTAEELAEGIDVEVEANNSTTVELTVIVGKMEDGKIIENMATVQEVVTKQEWETNIVKRTYIEPNINSVKKVEILDSENDYAVEGDTLKYTIEITNDGRLSKEVNIKDQIPSEVEIDGDITVESASGQQTYTKDQLEGEGITVTVPGTENGIKVTEEPPIITPIGGMLPSGFQGAKLITAILNDDPNPIFTSNDSILRNQDGRLIGYNYSLEENWLTSYSLEFTIDCQKFVMIHESPSFRLYVDEGNGYEMTSYEGENVKGPYYLVEFPDKKSRHIKLELNNTFSGLYILNTDEVTRYDRQSNDKVLFVGDDWVLDSSSDGYTSYANVISNILGLECVKNVVSQTGYTVGSVKYYDRIKYEIERAEPKVTVISGGLNDYREKIEDGLSEQEISEIAEEARNCYNYILETALNTKLIVIGVQYPSGSIPEDVSKLNEAIKQVAQEEGVAYIDLLTGDTITEDGLTLTQGSGPYITGTGYVGQEKGDGNADKYITENGALLSVEGHRYLGDVLANEIRKILSYGSVAIGDYNNKVTVTFNVKVREGILSQKGEATIQIQNTASVDNEYTNTATVEVQRGEVTINIKVTKTWNDEGNTKARPKQIKFIVKNGDEKVQEYIVSETDDWSHVFEGLPKYDSETGEEIQYTVDEEAVGEENLDYYEKEVIKVTQ